MYLKFFEIPVKRTLNKSLSTIFKKFTKKKKKVDKLEEAGSGSSSNCEEFSYGDSNSCCSVIGFIEKSFVFWIYNKKFLVNFCMSELEPGEFDNNDISSESIDDMLEDNVYDKYSVDDGPESIWSVCKSI